MELSIEHKRQIRKFNLYGFLKNLKLFEPFLLYYIFISVDDYLHIGILIAIRELIIYVFEVPSGVLADKYGKKNQLILCFSFYILSFIAFFIGGDFYVFVIAFILYGFGEAFRSGTHKAMIMDYLDNENIVESKSKIYGKTRSYSMIGSMISSIVAIALIFILPELRFLFLIAIIPYIIDILLISSYPSYMNERLNTSFSIKEFGLHMVKSVKYGFHEKKVRKLLISSATFNGWFKTLKDYVQFIILLVPLTAFASLSLTDDENNRVYLGVIYAFIYLVAAITSRNTYRLKKYYKGSVLLDFMWIPFGVTILLIGLFTEQIVFVFILFAILYIILNLRKPLMIEKIGDEIVNTERATMLSVESQLTSLFIIVFAPLLGYISNVHGIEAMMIIVGVSITFVQIIKLVIKLLRN
jgi:MFS family permease